MTGGGRGTNGAPAPGATAGAGGTTEGARVGADGAGFMGSVGGVAIGTPGHTGSRWVGGALGGEDAGRMMAGPPAGAGPVAGAWRVTGAAGGAVRGFPGGLSLLMRLLYPRTAAGRSRAP